MRKELTNVLSAYRGYEKLLESDPVLPRLLRWKEAGGKEKAI